MISKCLVYQLGGAEQLVVNIAKAIQQDLRHEVYLLTTHHDPLHSFEETKKDGSRNFFGKVQMHLSTT